LRELINQQIGKRLLIFFSSADGTLFESIKWRVRNKKKNEVIIDDLFAGY
jgi:hypothetical protein